MRIERESISYDDILLIPQFSDIESRKEINIGNWLDQDRGLRFELPIISAPMDTVTEIPMAITLARMGGLGIIHRYNSVSQQAQMAETLFENIEPSKVGFAIGITGDYLERAKELVSLGARILCLDVAHGDHVLVQYAIKSIRDALGNGPHIMAGNVATFVGFDNLASWGANSIRVGIGGGCFTPSSLVHTENGYKPIKDIVIGDKVYTHDGTLKPVINTMTFDRNEEIMVIDGIECTKNHEFYVIPKEVSHLVNDDNISQFAIWVEAQHLDKDKYFLVELE
jgi:IMP dehydrogenase/GMP reductase